MCVNYVRLCEWAGVGGVLRSLADVEKQRRPELQLGQGVFRQVCLSMCACAGR